ncbi:MAG: polysaccharide pyruvyl transferase CsaB [Dialister sp.]|nr:polysaccharide pyruvyl transferase CsaB [Dialister sp.]
MAKRRIVISGYYGFNNAGDEAMLTAILQDLRNNYEDLDITVISGNPSKTASAMSVHAIPRFSLWQIVKTVMHSDLLISGGGSLLQDVTSWKSMVYYLSIITLAVTFRKKVFLYSQGIGPVRYRVIRVLLKEVLNRGVTAITVRDKESKGFLERLGVKTKIYLTADAVLSLPPVSKHIGQEILSHAGISFEKKNIGISVRSWNTSAGWMEGFRKYISDLSKREACRFVFIPMQYPEDVRAAKKLAQGLPNCYILDQSYSIKELLSLTASMDVLVGMRLHALVFSAINHVPMIGISYDPKIDNFLTLIGKKAACSVTSFSPDLLCRETEREMHTVYTKEDWALTDALCKRADKNIEILKSVFTSKEDLA